jgi:hypothetical protein
MFKFVCFSYKSLLDFVQVNDGDIGVSLRALVSRPGDYGRGPGLMRVVGLFWEAVFLQETNIAR